MSITTITSRLDELSSKYEAGTLSREEIGEMTDLARQLYEHLVIIRHQGLDTKVEAAEEENSTEIVAESESNYETDEVEISPNQISLIDSIEELKLMDQSINANFSDDQELSLSQKIGSQGVVDLIAAISINQKFKFIANLFGGDQKAYDGALEKLNGFSSYIEADEYIENVVKDRFDWESNSADVKDFITLIERKFL